MAVRDQWRTITPRLTLILSSVRSPFDFGEREPSTEEVSRTEQNIQVDCLKDLQDTSHSNRHDTSLSALLSGAYSENPAVPEASEAAWAADDLFTCSTKTMGEDCFVLTASERRRIHGVPDPIPEDVCSEEDPEGPPAKRLKQPREAGFIDASSWTSQPRSVRFGERHYIHYEPVEDLEEGLDDSGVFLPDLQETRVEETTCDDPPPIFGDLSSAAEGFLGADHDGDVIPDIDPVHTALDDYPPASHSGWLSAGLRNRLPSLEPCIATLDDSPPDIVTDLDKRLALDAETHTDLEKRPAPQVHRKCHRETGDTIDESTSQPHISVDPPSLAPSAGQSLRRFMNLRSKEVAPEEARESCLAPESYVQPFTAILPAIEVPVDLIDTLTLQPAASSPGMLDVHRYLASLAFIQKRGLVQALRNSAVELVEREQLDGADMILAADFAVLLTPLRTLPARECIGLMTLLALTEVETRLLRTPLGL